MNATFTGSCCPASHVVLHAHTFCQLPDPNAKHTEYLLGAETALPTVFTSCVI